MRLSRFVYDHWLYGFFSKKATLNCQMDIPFITDWNGSIVNEHILEYTKALPTGTKIGTFLTLIRWTFSGIYYHSVINAYKNTDLTNALLTIFSVFFGAIIIMISIFISAGISKNHTNFPDPKKN
jgi:hypothetical protein